MAVYSYTSLRTNQRFGPYQIPSASGQLIAIALMYFPSGGASTTTVERAYIIRASAATVTKLEPEHSNTRSPNQAGSSGALETVSPTNTGNPFVYMGIGPENLWTGGHYQFPRPYARYVTNAGEIATFQTQTNSGSSIGVDFNVRFAEGELSGSIDRVARRPREHGWWHRCAQKRNKLQAGTSPPTSHQYVHDRANWNVMSAARQFYLRQHDMPSVLRSATYLYGVADTALSFSDSLSASHGLTGTIADNALSLSTIYLDTFSRSVGAGGWGTADSGQTWAAEGTTTASFYSVDGAEGQVTPTANGTQIFGIDPGGAFTDGDLYCDVTTSAVPTGTQGANMGVGFRTQATSPEQNYYRARLVFSASGANPTVELAAVVANTATVIGSVVSSFSYTAGDWWRIHVAATGSEIRVRAWPVASSEPGTWDIDTTDSSWTSGGVLTRIQVSGGARPVLGFDNLTYGAPFDSVSAAKSSGGFSYGVSDTALSFSDSVKTVRQRNLTDTALSFADSIGVLRARNTSDTALSFSDTLASTRQRPLSDNVLTFSDSVNTATSHPRSITDTALSFSDSVGRTAVLHRAVADTALSFSDSLGRSAIFSRNVSDTVLTFSDVIAATRPHNVSDTALAFSDSLSRIVLRTITDAALAFSDSLVRMGTFARSVADTALSFADNIATSRVLARSISDTALSFSDSLATPRKRTISDTALSLSETIASSRLRSISDIALTFSDSLVRTFTPGQGGGSGSKLIDQVLAEQYPMTITDTFGRTVASGLGTATSGEVWTAGTIAWSANGTAAQTTPTNNSTNYASLQSVNGGDMETLVDIAFSAIPAGNNVSAGTNVRGVAGLGTNTFSNSGYIARLVLQTSGILQVRIERSRAGQTPVIGSGVQVVASYTPGDFYRMRFNATGQTLSVKAWKVGTAEPGSWNVQTTDATWLSGVVGIFGSASLGLTSGATVSYENFSSTPLTPMDSIGRTPVARTLSDTVLSFSDSVARTGSGTANVTDQVLTFNDLVGILQGRGPSDSALSFSDLVTTSHSQARSVSDTVLAFSDSISSIRQRRISDNALVFSDTLVRSVRRSVSDTALSFSDFISATRPHDVTDQVLIFSDTLIHTSSRKITDTGLVFSDHLVISLQRSVTETGLTLADSVATHVARVYSIGIADSVLTFSDFVIAVQPFRGGAPPLLAQII